MPRHKSGVVPARDASSIAAATHYGYKDTTFHYNWRIWAQCERAALPHARKCRGVPTPSSRGQSWAPASTKAAAQASLHVSWRASPQDVPPAPPLPPPPPTQHSPHPARRHLSPACATACACVLWNARGMHAGATARISGRSWRSLKNRASRLGASVARCTGGVTVSRPEGGRSARRLCFHRTTTTTTTTTQASPRTHRGTHAPCVARPPRRAPRPRAGARTTRPPAPPRPPRRRPAAAAPPRAPARARAPPSTQSPAPLPRPRSRPCRPIRRAGPRAPPPPPRARVPARAT